MGEIQLNIIVLSTSQSVHLISQKLAKASTNVFFALGHGLRGSTAKKVWYLPFFLPFFLDTTWVGFTILDPEQVKLNECGSILIRKTTVDKSATFILNNRGRYVMNNSMPK